MVEAERGRVGCSYGSHQESMGCDSPSPAGLFAAVPGCTGPSRGQDELPACSPRHGFPPLKQLVWEQFGAGWRGWARGSASDASFSPCQAGNMGRGGAER